MTRSTRMETISLLLGLSACVSCLAGCQSGGGGGGGGGGNHSNGPGLTLTITGQGSITAAPGGTYADDEVPTTLALDAGTVVQLAATPENGWEFQGWSGDLTGTTNPATLTVNGAMQVEAVFVNTNPDDNANDNVGNNDNGNDNDEPVVLQDTDIDVDTTIPDGVHIVDENITVRDGAILTLEPGARLEFGANTRLFVEPGGVLSAAGTEDQPIVLTAQDPTRGYWNGVEFNASNSSSNVLEYVIIEYGGTDGENQTGNIVFWGESRVAVRHCTLRESASMGFAFNYNSLGSNVTFEDNTFTRNTLGAGKVEVYQVDSLNATNTYTGNDVDRILVGVGGEVAMEADHTWHGIDVDYEVNCSVSTHAPMTVEPGVRMAFWAGRTLTVYEDGGVLTAEGTADDPIVFTATDPTPGYWSGIVYRASIASENVLRYLTVEYATGGSANAALTIWDHATVQVDHCTFQHSTGYGIYMRGATVNADIQTANTFVDNALGDCYEAP